LVQPVLSQIRSRSPALSFTNTETKEDGVHGNVKLSKEVNSLNDYALACAIIHGLCSVTALTLYFSLDSYMNYQAPITRYVIHPGYYEAVKVFDWNLTLGSAAFSFLSSIFHFITLGYWDDYLERV